MADDPLSGRAEGGHRAVLVLRLSGPLMAFGVTPAGERRHTALRPTPGAVAGMLAAALGREREEDRSDLLALRMEVRVLRPGRLGVDFTTAEAVVSSDGSKVHERAVSRRYHLEDADFLVGLEGPAPLLARLERALREPAWAPALGRRAFFPDRPLLALPLAEGPLEARLEEAVLESA